MIDKYFINISFFNKYAITIYLGQNFLIWQFNKYILVFIFNSSSNKFNGET